jgi:foldase protein PrsA
MTNMQKLMRSLLLITLIVCFASSSFSATKTVVKKAKPKPKTAVVKPVAKPAKTAKPAAPAKPVEWAVKVNGDIISMDWYNRVVEATKKQFEKEISVESAAAEYTGDLPKETKRQILEQMIEAVILMEWSKREGIVINDKTVATRVTEYKKSFPSSQEFYKTIKEQGMTIDDLKMDIRKQIIMEKMINIRAKNIAVTDEEMKSFYEKNSDLYGQNDKFHIKAVHVKQLKDAEKIKTFLDNKGKFIGDDLGFLEDGQLPIDEKDQGKVFNLKEGQVSDIISGEAGDSGYYIFKVEELQQGKKAKFTEVESTIRKFLLREKARVQYTQDLQSEKQNAKIIISEKLTSVFE